MANTLKFGSGQWATKVGSTLAYNDENGNFKPLPFTFDRSTSATRVNKDGLIEVVSNNEPRIDFLNDSKGALLLEPSRSNLNNYSDPTDAQKGSLSYASVTYQDDFNWGLGDVIKNAIVFGDNSTTRYAYYSSTVSSGASYSLSFFIKMDDNSVPIPATDFLLVLAGTSIASGYTIDNYGNNVYRVSVSGTAGASNTANGILKVASHSAKTFKITGFQLESNSSYPTSYIPTQGSIGTRGAESCSQTVPDGIIGQTEGTMFLEIDFKNTSEVAGAWSISSGSSANRITMNTIGFSSTQFTLSIAQNYNSSSTKLASTNVTYIDNHKVAIKYSATTLKLFVDGQLSDSVSTDGFGNYTKFYIGGNQVGVGGDTRKFIQADLYNEALTDQQLISLTKI